MDNGIVIDLQLLNEVTSSEHCSSVTIGTGARWMDVYKTLDEKGLVVAGGRNLDVDVALHRFKNDLTTLMEIHALYKRGVKTLRRVKGLTWTLIFHPLLPQMAKQGQADSMGFADRTEPLVIILFTVIWEKKTDDELVGQTTRAIISDIDDFATSKGTANSYRYLNNCASWQSLFDGYGAENKRFLQPMSRMYDPDGLFQQTCIGGFKLDMDVSNP
ncbi:MAG: hypothetical protein Q9195_008505 [Heterodermia aff. obscurata]